MPTSSGPSTSNNWGWADILKRVFTLVELGPLQKWAAKPIGNKNDNTLKKVSDNTLKIRSEWQHTQEKVSTTAQENVFQEDHEWSSWENREKLDWAWKRIWLIECFCHTPEQIKQIRGA
jgi:hypothetical protein